MTTHKEMKEGLEGRGFAKDDMWTKEEFTKEFEVVGFSSPYANVARKSDGAKGSVRFIHMPRVYYGFKISS